MLMAPASMVGLLSVVQRRGGWRWRGFEGALVVITQWIRVLSVRLTEQAAQLGQHPSSTSPAQSQARNGDIDDRRSPPGVKCKKNRPRARSKSLAYTSSRPAYFIDFSATLIQQPQLSLTPGLAPRKGCQSSRKRSPARSRRGQALQSPSSKPGRGVADNDHAAAPRRHSGPPRDSTLISIHEGRKAQTPSEGRRRLPHRGVWGGRLVPDAL